MSNVPFLATSGDPSDIENFAYQRNHFSFLPPPSNGTPFGLQGSPLPDPQQIHVSAYAVAEATKYLQSNLLPFQRFVGTYHHQIHQPQGLSVNEIIFN